MYNDVVTTVGKGKGSFLVLLNLSTAFDTIDYDLKNCIPESLSELAMVYYALCSTPNWRCPLRYLYRKRF